MKKGTKLISSFLKTYEILDQCGQGGNSTIYKAKDTDDNYYALKVINQTTDKNKIERFKNEINFCQKNEHSNIIKVLDNGIYIDVNFKGSVENFMFYVMPLYSKNFKNIINENHTFEKFLEYFNQILEAVKFVHNKGSFHRDIKPENILIDSEKNICILADFGIAHFAEEDLYTAIETKLTDKLANFQYTAPEQREREIQVTYKCDIYSLGLILNQIFTKKIPAGSDYSKIKDFSTPYGFLDNIVEKMIAQNPNNRYENIQEIQQDIKVNIEIYNSNKNIEKLKNIKYTLSEEKDLLILEPPELISWDYNENNEILSLYLDKPINQYWINSISECSRTSLGGYELENFTFRGEVATILVRFSNINAIQQIIHYFKEWVSIANSVYPIKIQTMREQELMTKESELKKKIEKEEKLKKIKENIKI